MLHFRGVEYKSGTIQYSSSNGDVEIAEAEAIRFEVQVAIAFDDDWVGCWENVVNLTKGNESSSEETFWAILEIQEDDILIWSAWRIAKLCTSIMQSTINYNIDQEYI